MAKKKLNDDGNEAGQMIDEAAYQKTMLKYKAAERAALVERTTPVPEQESAPEQRAVPEPE